MSIFGKIKHGMDKAGDKISKTANDAGKAINKAAEESISGVEHLAHEVKEEGMSVGGDIEKLVGNATGKINEFKNAAIGEIRSAESTAVSSVRKTGEAVAGDVKHLVVDQVPEVLAEVLSQLAQEAIKPGLKGAAALAKSIGDEMDKLAKEDPELVKAINQCGFRIEIKANVKIILVYSGFYTRFREMSAILDRAGNEGIALRRRDLIGFVESLGPTSIAFGGGAEISLGFDLGASASLTSIPLKLFTRLADRGLKAMGVPE